MATFDPGHSAGAAGRSRGVLLSTSASAVSVAISLCSVFYNELGGCPRWDRPSKLRCSKRKHRESWRQQMLMRRDQVFADMSSEACLGVAAAWSGAVGGLLLVMLLGRLFS